MYLILLIVCDLTLLIVCDLILLIVCDLILLIICDLILLIVCDLIPCDQDSCSVCAAFFFVLDLTRTWSYYYIESRLSDPVADHYCDLQSHILSVHHLPPPHPEPHPLPQLLPLVPHLLPQSQQRDPHHPQQLWPGPLPPQSCVPYLIYPCAETRHVNIPYTRTTAKTILLVQAAI